MVLLEMEDLYRPWGGFSLFIFLISLGRVNIEPLNGRGTAASEIYKGLTIYVSIIACLSACLSMHKGSPIYKF